MPFALIGQRVEVLRRDGRITIYHRDALVAEHPELEGKYRLRILPEHGPGAIARNTRQRRSAPPPATRPWLATPTEVEVRDLSVYERAASAVEVLP